MLHRDIATGRLAHTQFDFWLGTWDLRWVTSEGHPRAGRNVVRKELGDAVVVERFTDPVGPDGRGFSGLSVSTYDVDAAAWRQTWVDSTGAHMGFSGGLEDDRMVLSRQIQLDGVSTTQRMVWHSIAEAAFIWDWERSTDDGATWTLAWRIEYLRSADDHPAG